jgi:hypothetical protein
MIKLFNVKVRPRPRSQLTTQLVKSRHLTRTSLLYFFLGPFKPNARARDVDAGAPNAPRRRDCCGTNAQHIASIRFSRHLRFFEIL